MGRTFAVAVVVLGCFCFSTNAVSDVGCGLTKGCFRFPQGCSLSNPTCIFFSYVWNPKSRNYNMELSGGFGGGSTYTAVAFGSSKSMQDADMYFCTGSDLKSGVIQDRYIIPVTSPRRMGVTNVTTASTSNGVANCQFSRQESVTRNISGGVSKTFNLTSDDVYVMLASSSYAGGQMQYHASQKWISDNAVRFGTSFQTTGGSATTAPSLPATTSPMASITTECNVTKRCLTNIEGCAPGDKQCIFLSWKYNSESATYDMELSGKPDMDFNYLAIAFASTPVMLDADLYFCANGVFRSGTILGKQMPVVDPSLPAGVEGNSTVSNNGILTCTFTRPASVIRITSSGNLKIFDLVSNNYHVLSATGVYIGGVMQYHSRSRWFTPQPINYTAGIEGTVESETRSPFSSVTTDSISVDTTPHTPSASEKTQTSIQNCTAGEDDCILLSWIYNSASRSFQMEITGKKQGYPHYIAVAFASHPIMSKADLYYCTESGFYTGVIRRLHTSPITDPSSPNGITGSTVQNEDGLVRCSFTRPASLTREVGGDSMKLFDLSSESFYILYARGFAVGNQIQYHSTSRWTSAGAVAFAVSLDDTPTTPAPIPPQLPQTTEEIRETTADPTTPASECGSTKHCLTNVPNCSLETTDCIQLSWKFPTSAGFLSPDFVPEHVELTISGRGIVGAQYLAFAFASKPEMKDADLYYCVGNGFGTGTIRNLYMPPILDASLPAGVSLQGNSASTNNGVLSCSFVRPTAINRTVSLGQVKIFDLSKEPFYVLFASGPYAGGMLAYHTPLYRWHSIKTNFAEGFDVTPVISTPTLVSTETVTTESTNTEMMPSICGDYANCITNIPNCTFGQEGCVVFSWTYEKDAEEFKMEISGGNGLPREYVAVAFSLGNRMYNADMYACTSNGLKSGAIRELQTPPTVDSVIPSDISMPEATEIDGKLRCRFRRARSVTKSVSGGQQQNFDLVSNEYHVLTATGTTSPDGALGYHSLNRWWSELTTFVPRQLGTRPTEISTHTSEIPETTQEMRETTTAPKTTLSQTGEVTSGSTAPASECGSTKQCLTNVPNCLQGTSACIQLTWRFTNSHLGTRTRRHTRLVGGDLPQNSGSEAVVMEISGRGIAGSEYLAVAFASTKEMKDADLYYCVGDGFGSGTIRKRAMPPTLDITLPVGVSLQGNGTSSNNGVLSCSFVRPTAINRTVSLGQVKTFDLSKEPYNVLFASGPYANGILGYHTISRRWASNKIDFVDGFVATPPDVSTTSSVASTSATESHSDDVGCGVTKGCFNMPPSCEPGSQNCIAVSWIHDSENKAFKFEIVGAARGGYAAIAFSPDGLMKESDMYYCTDTGLKTGVIRGRHDPPLVDSNEDFLSDVISQTTNGITNCTFTRPDSVTRNVGSNRQTNFSLTSDNYYMLVAMGLQSGGVIMYHGNERSASASPVNFTLREARTSGNSGGSRSRALIKAHASLMILAWVTCASIGVLIARHFKPLWHGSTCFGTKVWFQVHRAIMSTAVIATIVAFILIFVYVGRYSSNAGAHPIIGIIVTALAISNPIMAFFRPHPNAPKRYLFNWGHWFVGVAARTLSVVAIFLGMDLTIFDLDKWVTWLMVAFVVLHIVTEITLEIVSARYGHIEAYVKPNKTDAVELSKRIGAERIPEPPKGASIKYGIMGVYVIINIGFLIAFIVAIAQH